MPAVARRVVFRPARRDRNAVWMAAGATVVSVAKELYAWRAFARPASPIVLGEPVDRMAATGTAASVLTGRSVARSPTSALI